MIGRKKPYSKTGIKRVPCARCGKPSQQQFEICALERRHVAICPDCDVSLNWLVLAFLGVPNIPALIDDYKKRLENDE